MNFGHRMLVSHRIVQFVEMDSVSETDFLFAVVDQKRKLAVAFVVVVENRMLVYLSSMYYYYRINLLYQRLAVNQMLQVHYRMMLMRKHQLK